MNEIRLSFEKFRFNEFVEKMLEFAGEVMDPAYAVPWVHGVGDIPEYDEDKEERDFLTELKEEGKHLYFNFSNSNIGEPINCADGKEYEIDEDSNFCLGEADSVGYLLQYQEGEIIINSALNAAGACVAPPPSIDLEKDCDVFDKPMEKFIKKFITV
jgi:hypothetical protein